MKSKYSLKKIYQSIPKLEPLKSFLYRPFTSRIQWLIANFTNLTPNQLTIISLLFSVISAWYFSQGNLIFGAILFEIKYLLDSIDGRLARLKNIKSEYGAFLDNYVGLWGNFLNTFALCYGMFYLTHKLIWLILAPFLLLAIILPFAESLMVNRLIEKEVKFLVVEKNRKKDIFAPLFKIKNKLNCLGLSEPFHMTDIKFLIFFIGPILQHFVGYLLEIILFSMILIGIKEIIFFFYYRDLLKKH